MRVKPHHHPCAKCKTKTECSGTWEENYDGFPEVICPEYHLPSVEIALCLCEACACVDCGEIATESMKDADSWSADGTEYFVSICDGCAERRRMKAVGVGD